MPSMKPHRGAIVLVLGILGLVMCGAFTGLPAWLMGNTDLNEMDSGLMDPEGRGLTNAGKILGMISTILFGISILFFIILLAFGLLTGAARQ